MREKAVQFVDLGDEVSARVFTTPGGARVVQVLDGKWRFDFFLNRRTAAANPTPLTENQDE